MQTDRISQPTVEIQSLTTEYVVAEPIVAAQIARLPHVEEDGVDWCAWWAEYAEMMQ